MMHIYIGGTTKAFMLLEQFWSSFDFLDQEKSQSFKEVKFVQLVECRTVEHQKIYILILKHDIFFEKQPKVSRSK